MRLFLFYISTIKQANHKCVSGVSFGQSSFLLFIYIKKEKSNAQSNSFSFQANSSVLLSGEASCVVVPLNLGQLDAVNSHIENTATHFLLNVSVFIEFYFRNNILRESRFV